MLIQLLPEQASSMWDAIKPAIMSSMPGHWKKDDIIATNLLQAILSENMQCWVNQDADSGRIDGVVLTTIFHDRCSGVKNLLIYGLASMQHAKIVDDTTWKEGMATLIKYAKTVGCDNITAYTTTQRVVDIADTLGCKKETFLFWEI